MTDTVKTWIEERQAIHAPAPGETWGNYGSGGFEVYDATEYDDGDMGEMLAYEVRTADIATAIVDAHNNLPRALDALNAVLELHVPETEYGPDYVSGRYPCVECNMSDQEGLHPTLWPCPTVQAIEGAIND